MKRYITAGTEADDNSGKTGWMIINYQPVCPQIERLAD